METTGVVLLGKIVRLKFYHIHRGVKDISATLKVLKVRVMIHPLPQSPLSLQFAYTEDRWVMENDS